MPNHEPRITNRPNVFDLVRRGALFVINHSGGKDGQAMFHVVRQFVPDEQIAIAHAHLPEVEWEDAIDHVHATTDGLPVHVIQARKTFFEMVEHRQMFPSPQQRQCTSDLKRGPLEKLIRRLSKDLQRPIIVNCMGLRAQESASRRRRPVWKFSERNSKAGREWWDWLPVHELSTEEVFSTIWAAGQKPHWVYAAGITRFSCCFCIMASDADLTKAAHLRPRLYSRYCGTEQRLGFTLRMDGRSLPEVTGIEPSDPAVMPQAA